MSIVAYLGPEGTFSWILARARFGEKKELFPCPAIDAVFEAVASGKCSTGLVPVENSSGGTVHDTIDLLIRHKGEVFITEEPSLDIRIALLGHKGTTPRTIHSHFTQITHHREWLKTRYPKSRLVPAASTTQAAAKAAESRGAAALASPGAAGIYGLDVLEIPEPASAVNVTNFFTISLAPARSTKSNRTALVAELKNQCGSLHKFLGPFARQGLSLTRIISRPVPGQPQTYVFYIELEGAASEEPVARALDAARRQARSLTPLGSFPVGRRFSS
jgi:chorismate mutase/prephenate dehydratase